MARQHSMLLLSIAIMLPAAAVASAPRYDDYPPRSLEPPTDPRGWGVAEVQDWVESCGFYEHREAFLEAKVDGRKLLGMNAASLRATLLLPSSEHAAILDMEIKELRARRNMLSASELKQHRVDYPLAESLDASDVARFLQDSGLGRYATAFAAARIDGKGLLRLRAEEIAALLAKAGPSEHEQSESDAEVLSSLIEHLRWRSRSSGSQTKQEL